MTDTQSRLNRAPSDATVIWRIIDGKPGHESQSQGLVTALGRRLPILQHDISAHPGLATLFMAFFRQCPGGIDLPRPDLILGAGHQTHATMLAARRTYGGRTILMMSPTLPCSLFDLCLVPQHDLPPQRENVVSTRGVLNAMTSSGTHHSERTLILIGGPSAHYGWDDEAMVEQVKMLHERALDQQFLLTTSRRTPERFLQRLAALNLERLQIVPADQTQSGWVARQLADVARAWVSEDSVSMVYEALTAGVNVGLLEVPQVKFGRVAAGVDLLMTEQWVTSFAQWQSGQALSRPPERFNEAERCADWICEKWLQNDS
ncbi:MAG: nucleoside-diphosphate sugar epimerase [Gammaproteobacteria bacterium]|nr:nucleoside-diphosphate sugar epimerase [Gammaproteobacteria bacterium]